MGMWSKVPKFAQNGLPTATRSVVSIPTPTVFFSQGMMHKYLPAEECEPPKTSVFQETRLILKVHHFKT